MKMDGEEQSSNVEDVRGSRGGGVRLGGGIGLGSVAIALLAWGVFGINPLTTLGVLGGIDSGQPTQQQAPTGGPPPANDAQATFVSNVLHSTETVWGDVFRKAGQTYQDPKLVLFRGSWPTACGTGQAAMGPFYCPGDRKVYLDLSFFDTMRKRLGADGDFAQAYVVAHEVGHHVQNLMGISDKVDAQRQRQSEAQANATSVRVELQADCFAGVWAARSQQQNGWRLEQGDIEEALNAAAQIGDDTLQRKSQGTVQPESFTHGTSAQRVSWFKRGLQGGDVNACDTFGARSL